MSQVAKSLHVSSGPDRIMEYIADVSNHPAFIGPLKAVTNLSGDPRKPGTTWDWTFIMAGVEFTGKAETVKYEPARSFSYKTTSGIQSLFNYRCEPAADGSNISMEVTYEIPQSLLSRVQAAVVEKMNDSEGSRVVENLKVILDE